jgi:nitroreductase
MIAPNAHRLLLSNKNFCIEETLSFIQQQVSAGVEEFKNFPETATSVEFCRRDIGFVIDAYLDLLEDETSDSMEFVSSRYWKGEVSSLVGNKNKEVTAHEFLKNLILNYVINNRVFSSSQAISNQHVDSVVAEEKATALILNNYALLINTILNGPSKKYLHNYLENRFTAKWWKDEPLKMDKVETILECAYQAPSKQGYHEFEIHVITDSDEGKDFKEWLYYENTACLDKIRAKPGVGLRRYNGQVLAPVVMIWLAKTYPAKEVNPYNESNWLRTNNDCIISSTMAMCQAEELGVRTGFCGCIGGREIADRLNRPNHTAVISIGFGYADPDNMISRQVFKDNVRIGFDLSNTAPAIRTAENRKRRPTKYSMVNFV